MGHIDRRTRLTRDDWIDAATTMGARVGFDRLAVEPLASELGSTKGSFYWHFEDRAALLDAVLERWERDATARIIEDVEHAPAEERLARLIDAAFGHSFEEVIEWRIFAAADHPQIGPVVGRVHDARTAYIRRLLAFQGLPAARAKARARVVYASYLGHVQLVSTRAGPPTRRAVADFLDELVALFTAP